MRLFTVYIHGKKLYNLVRRIKSSPKTFLITSGVKDINQLGELLTDAGMQKCEIITGYQLSYEEQRVERHTPVECMELKEEGLIYMFCQKSICDAKKIDTWYCRWSIYQGQGFP